MNSLRTNLGLRWKGVCGVAVWLAAAWAWGVILPLLYVGNLEPVRDQYGRMMIGSHLSAGATNRSLVEIRAPTDGIIRPPSTNGAAHPYNPLLSADSVGGMGMNTATSDSGLFCMVFPSRPTPGKKIFVRAYNAPTVAEASFYADSAIAVISSNDASLVVVFGVAKPLNSGDDDADGLNNSWEKALGTADRLTDDYDGDGMLDLHEMLAGTSPTDPGSLLEFKFIRREAGPALADKGEDEEEGHSVRMRWQSVPGRRYQLQFLPNLLGEQVIVPIGEVVTAGAGDSEMEMLVEVPDEAAAGSFRIKLVRD
jgi:hypothetical protein